MTIDTRVNPVDLNIEIRELVVKLKQAEIGDKEKIADELAKLRTMRRSQRSRLEIMRSKMHEVAQVFDKTHRSRVDID